MDPYLLYLTLVPPCILTLAAGCHCGSGLYTSLVDDDVTEAEETTPLGAIAAVDATAGGVRPLCHCRGQSERSRDIGYLCAFMRGPRRCGSSSLWFCRHLSLNSGRCELFRTPSTASRSSAIAFRCTQRQSPVVRGHCPIVNFRHSRHSYDEFTVELGNNDGYGHTTCHVPRTPTHS